MYIGKLDGVKQYEQKRYFLWPLRDVLDVWNGSVVNQSETYTERFAGKLAFSMFCNFIKMHKGYVFMRKFLVLHIYVRLVKLALLAIGLGHACIYRHIPSDPQSIAEFYSCNDSKAYMINLCYKCCAHGFTDKDFTRQSLESEPDGTSSEDCDSRIQFHQWKKNDGEYIAKVYIVINLERASELSQEKITSLKKQIYTKCQQNKEYKHMKAELKN